MSSNSIGAHIDVVPSSYPKLQTLEGAPLALSVPATTKQISPIPSDTIKLNAITGRTESNGSRVTPVSSSHTPNELESGRPCSPNVRNVVEQIQSFSNPPMNRWRVFCTCAIYFGNGLTDSAPGALIPYMEKSYDIGYAIVSLIFVTNAAGFIAAAFFIDALHQRLGRAKTLMLSELMIIAGYILIGVRPPFAVVVASYFLLGAGAAINLALNNVFCANLANSTVILGASHGSYGLGGTIAPIAATALVSKDIVWSRFYLIIVAVRVLILPFAGWAFGNYEKEAPSTLLERSAYGATTRESKVAMLKRALRNRVTILGALFIFAYQGAEVSISGWVISFLISYRGGDPGKVGYVTAGFWAGITIGRFVLTHLTSHIGDKVSVYGLVAGTTALQILVWLVPNVISNAVFVSLLRLLLGPVYPCAQSIFSHSLPRSIQMSSIGLISSAGSSGGAVAPFMTGLLAQAKGTWVLHPICVSLFGCMVVCWWCLPRVEKRAV